MSKLKQYLTEERLSSQDKRMLLKLIDKPKKSKSYFSGKLSVV